MRPHNTVFVTLAASVAVAIGTGALVLRTGPATAQVAATIADRSADRPLPQPDPFIAQRTKGDPSAPLTIYEISDFQCPYCRNFWEETLPVIEREYVQTGKAQFVFLNLPLIQLHPNAAAAHEFAMCAAQQDRFWPVHDLLYRHQETWAGLAEPRSFFMLLADSAALNRDSVVTCVDTGAVRWLVQQEASAMGQRGIRSTPSFVIENSILPGAQPIEVWRPILDSLFAVKTGGK